MLATGVAVGVLFGLAREANRFGLGVSVAVLFFASVGFASEAKGLGLGASAAALLLCSTGLRLLNRLFEVVEATSCTCEVDAAPNRKGVVLGAEGSLANILLTEADAGVLALGVAELDAPNMLVEGAVVAVPSLFCAVVPKLNKLDAGAVTAPLPAPCVLEPILPNKFF